MISFPNAKINIGLHVLEKRPDNYHTIETVLYPVGWSDILEAVKVKGNGKIELRMSGLKINGKKKDNLCVKAYTILNEKYSLPSVKVWLHKCIPAGAGLGGGSSDATFFIKMMNEMFYLDMTKTGMRHIANALGTDCSFFIDNKPSVAAGLGDKTGPADINLDSYHVCIVFPHIEINTGEAYSMVQSKKERKHLKYLVKSSSIMNWRNTVVNDFETEIIKRFPLIGKIKETFYDEGAIYASMTGSGSAVYGISKKRIEVTRHFPGYTIWNEELKTE